MTTLIELKNVSKVFKSRRQLTVAVDDFSMSISDDVPSFTAIAGESGSGKTTLAQILLGFTRPTSGEVLYRGKNLWTMPRDEWLQFRRDVQAVFQDPFEVFNPFYRVDHLLTGPIEKFRLAKSKEQAHNQIEEALNDVGLRPEETLGRYPHQLSGGQRQRLTIARALLLHPRLIIADEPVSMVDASLRATILDSLRKLNTDFGISFLYITHDLATAYQIGQNIVVLYRGSVMELGDIDLVIQEPQHPYSRLLVSSIPEPDVDQRWAQDELIQGKSAIRAAANRGCKFADRCPYVMPECTQMVPPLFRTDRRRAVACFLHKNGTTTAAELMNDAVLHH